MNLRQELNEWDGTWPSCWRPQAGEVLIGRIVRYDIGQTAFGPVRTVILRREDGGMVSIWLSSEVLRREFARQKPQVGETIGIKCAGKHPEKGYWQYRLLIDRAEPEPDFSPLGGEESSDALDPFTGEPCG